ncbi:MAG: AarF/ABC1/UbiB kinase family protein [Bacteroidetes bacterium]|nr:AarF/ABC1/UbiB kinase family protein [Bacteroidota bacterium]MCH8524587.1 AarF/ABC1/UbiB kinase family protein [Balneolales bacterium]
MSDFPSSKFERGRIMAKTGLKVGANYAGYHLKRVLGQKDENAKKALNTQNATDVLREFSKLRGTALKLAQTMSLDTGLLPEEFVDIMTQAQYKVPPINRVLVRTIIKRELGEYPEKLFASFTPDAVAAASIGQVHRATLLDGREVAVKIQYPNVRETIDSDLAIAKSVFKRLVDHPSTDDYFDEVRSKLLEETDYYNEGRQMESYATLFNSEKFETPRWIPELSTQRVLTMTYLNGRHLDSFLKEKPTQEEKNHFGQLMWDFFHAQIDNNYTVYADAHPGNFLFTYEGKLGILDFGCIKKSPPDFFNNYIRLFDVHMRDDEAGMRSVYQNLEMIDRNPKDKDFEERFYAFCRGFGNHFLSPYTYDSFDFGDPSYERIIGEYAREATKFTEPRGSKHFIYVSRLHVGLYQMLMKLSAVVETPDARRLLENYLQKISPAVDLEEGAIL